MIASVIFLAVVLLFVGCGLLTWIAVRGASRAASIEEIAARMQRSTSKARARVRRYSSVMWTSITTTSTARPRCLT